MSSINHSLSIHGFDVTRSIASIKVDGASLSNTSSQLLPLKTSTQRPEAETLFPQIRPKPLLSPMLKIGKLHLIAAVSLWFIFLHTEGENYNFSLSLTLKSSLKPQTVFEEVRTRTKCPHFPNMSSLSRSTTGPHKDRGTRAHTHSLNLLQKPRHYRH